MTQTDIVLAFNGGKAVIVFGVPHEREQANKFDADLSDAEWYDKFINMKSLADVVLCAEHFGSLFANKEHETKFQYYVNDEKRTYSRAVLVTNDEWGIPEGSPQNVDHPSKPNPTKLQKWNFPNAKRTEKEDIKAICECWGLDGLMLPKPSTLPGDHGKGGTYWFTYETLKDWLQAAKDLRTACKILASPFENCSKEKINILGTPSKFIPSSRLQLFYETRISDPNNNMLIDRLDDANKTQQAVTAFNVILSGGNNRLKYCDGSLVSEYEPLCPLQKIWEYYRKKLLTGNVLVCANPKCQKIIASKRHNKRYCSRSCWQSEKNASKLSKTIHTHTVKKKGGNEL